MICYATNVSEFKRWFLKQHKQLEQQISQQNIDEATKAVKEQLERVLKDCSFQLHYHLKKQQFILEFNTLLDPMKKVLSHYLCQQLMTLKLKQWCFYYYHPAFNGSIDFNNQTISVNDVKVIAVPDKSKKVFHIKVIKNDIIASMNDQDSYTVLYLLLIDAIGEIGTEAYIGTIEYADKMSLFKYRKHPKIKLNQLKSYIDQICQKLNWQSMDDIYFIIERYKQKSKSYQLREDILEGATYCLDLLNEEYRTERPLKEVLNTSGIGYYSLVLSHAVTVDKKTITQQRKTLEENLTMILNKEHGVIVNAAYGKAHSYIDYFVYQPSVQEIIEHTFKQKQIEIIEL